MTKLVVLVLAALCAAPSAHAAVPTLWRSEAQLSQKKLVAKVAARTPHDRRVLGACVRRSRLAFDCLAELRRVETVAGEQIRTVRRYRVTVRRSASPRGFRTVGRIAQVSYREG